MRQNETLRSTAFLILLVASSLSAPFSVAEQAKKKPDGPPAKLSGIARLWQNPGNVGSLDLYWGKGSANKAPKPPFQFIEEDLSGSNPKVDVKDADGVKWGVKFAGSTNEVHSGVAANRILWATGYGVDETYFVPSGRIEGVQTLKREKSTLRPDGSFTDARFKKKSKAEEHLGYEWDWTNNPFAGTKELSGLKILMTMLNNWDTKSSNNDVVQVKNEKGEVENWYLVSDLGVSFGKMAVLPSNKNRWNLEDFKRQKFIDRYLNDGNEIKLHYRGKARLGVVPTEHARWFSGLVGQLSEAQFKKAFEAAGASPAEISGFSAKLMEKVGELQRFAGPQTPGSAPMPGKEVNLRVKLSKQP